MAVRRRFEPHPCLIQALRKYVARDAAFALLEKPVEKPYGYRQPLRYEPRGEISLAQMLINQSLCGLKLSHPNCLPGVVVIEVLAASRRGQAHQGVQRQTAMFRYQMRHLGRKGVEVGPQQCAYAR